MAVGSRRRAALCLAALIIVLTICNIVFAYSNGWARVGCQLFGFGGLLFVYKAAGLALSDIGLDKKRLTAGLKYGLTAILLIAVVLTLVFFVDQNIFKDSRYHHTVRTALAAGLLIVPVKVVIFEELAFRGLIPALLKGLGSKPWHIAVISSFLFGLWHIATAPKADNLTAGSFSNLLIIGAVVLATFGGGLILYLLRRRSDSLLASILVHWFINGSTTVLAALSWL